MLSSNRCISQKSLMKLSRPASTHHCHKLWRRLWNRMLFYIFQISFSSQRQCHEHNWWRHQDCSPIATQRLQASKTWTSPVRHQTNSKASTSWVTNSILASIYTVKHLVDCALAVQQMPHNCRYWWQLHCEDRPRIAKLERGRWVPTPKATALPVAMQKAKRHKVQLLFVTMKPSHQRNLLPVSALGSNKATTHWFGA